MRFCFLLSALGIGVTLAHTSVASAEERGEEPLSEPFAAMLVPSVTGVVFAPRADDAGLQLGVGGQILLFTWANRSDGFGPGIGKVSFDVAGLWDTNDGSTWTIIYRGGAAVSFERAPARSWLIPYFSAHIGGVHDSRFGGSAFADPGGGLYLVHMKTFMVDVEAAYLFAFAEPDDLSGFESHLTASFALW